MIISKRKLFISDISGEFKKAKLSIAFFAFCLSMWILCSYLLDTMCPRSSDPFYIVSSYIKWVTTSWTHGINTSTKW